MAIHDHDHAVLCCVGYTEAGESSDVEADSHNIDHNQPQEDQEEEDSVEWIMNRKFPDLPSSVPLTYVLAMHACLSSKPGERPTFAQVPFHFRFHSMYCTAAAALLC